MSNKLKKYLLGVGGSLISASALMATVACGTGESDSVSTVDDLESRKDDLNAYINFVAEDDKVSLKASVEAATTPEDLEALEEKIKESVDKNNPGYFERLKSSKSTNRKFAQKVKNEIILATTFSQTGAQSKALESVLTAYNALVDEMEKVKSSSMTDAEKATKYKELGISPLAKKVKHQVIGSGYPAGAEKVRLALSSGDKDNFFNIILNYSTVAAKLAERTVNSKGELEPGMLLSFNSLDKDLDVDTSLFDDGFSAVNKEIENVESDSTYVLPLFKSTQVLAINAPVLGYILDTMKENGVQWAEDSAEFFEKIIAAGKADRNSVKTLWGEKVSSFDKLLETYKAEGFKLSKNIFESYDELVKFSNIAQSLFTVSSAGVDSPVHVFGIDDMTGVYEQALFSALDGNKSNMLQTVSTNNGRVNVEFNSIKNTNGAAYIKSQEIFNTFTSAFEKGAVYAFPSGQYSSNDQTKHKFAFSIGSTAGYFHNFKKGNSSVTTVSAEGYEFELSNFAGANEFKSEGKNKEAIAYIGGRANAILGFGKQEKAGQYDYYAKTQEDENKIKELFNKETKTSTLNLFFEAAKIQTGKLAEYIKFLESKKSELPFKTYTVIKKSDNKEYIVYAFEGVLEANALAFKNNEFTNHIVKVLSDTNLLNEEELISIPTPGKWKPENAKKVLFAQGPSLIGIKSNDEDEAATKAFVKWLVTYEKEVDISKNKKNIPLVEVQKAASYISALKGINEKSETEASKIYGTNKYLKIAYEEFAKTSTEKNYIVFEEPAGSDSDSFRKNIGTAWETVQSGYVNKTTTKKSFDEFVKDMTQGIKG
nr:P80 family lipoprotein [Mycoplasmopsis canis]WQQ12431.1 P80 family lipoprotein [Mycoplasmopsis canis]